MADDRLLVVVNPRGGRRRGMSTLEQVRPTLTGRFSQLDVRATQHRGHAREIVRECDLSGCSGICVVGGDGTIHEVVSGLMERSDAAKIPIGVIPTGSGNDVARQLEIPDAQTAAQRIVHGQTVEFDVARVESAAQVDYSVILVGWVGVADVNGRAERLRAFGPARYTISALWQAMLPKRRRAKLVLDDDVIEDRFLLVAACNTLFAGSGMRLAPRAKVDDGLLDVLLIRSASRLQLLHIFAKVFSGSHVELPCVEYRQVRSLDIAADAGGPLDVDGEVTGGTPVSIHTLARAVKFFGGA